MRSAKVRPNLESSKQHLHGVRTITRTALSALAPTRGSAPLGSPALALPCGEPSPDAPQLRPFNRPGAALLPTRAAVADANRGTEIVAGLGKPCDLRRGSFAGSVSHPSRAQAADKFEQTAQLGTLVAGIALHQSHHQGPEVPNGSNFRPLRRRRSVSILRSPEQSLRNLAPPPDASPLRPLSRDGRTCTTPIVSDPIASHESCGSGPRPGPASLSLAQHWR
jgi:hypothetical protein